MLDSVSDLSDEKLFLLCLLLGLLLFFLFLSFVALVAAAAADSAIPDGLRSCQVWRFCVRESFPVAVKYLLSSIPAASGVTPATSHGHFRVAANKHVLIVFEENVLSRGVVKIICLKSRVVNRHRSRLMTSFAQHCTYLFIRATQFPFRLPMLASFRIFSVSVGCVVSPCKFPCPATPASRPATLCRTAPSMPAASLLTSIVRTFMTTA